jgi:neutral ceramidase
MRKVFKWLVYFTGIVVVVVFSLVGPIDRTALHEQPFYLEMMNALDTIQYHQTTKQRVKVGWGKYNITPAFNMPMAGYKPRNHFESVHDSLYTRILALDNGKLVFIVSADLLLFPPSVKEKIETKIKEKLPHAFLYFSATHTHNGLGGWDNSIAGQLIAGNYHEAWVNQISEGIVQTLLKINNELDYGSIAYFETNPTGLAANRLAGENGKVDSKLRGIKLVREDSTKAILVSFSAHATSISKKINSLSGDYPSVLEKELENNGYDFALFAAGMVGSHRLDGFTAENFDLTEMAGKKIASKILRGSIDSKRSDSVSINTAHLPIQYGPSQLRIEKNWRLRDWVFRSLLRPLQGEITYLEIGDIILLGTSCDFSGEVSVDAELEKLALAEGKNLIITSFNGNYTGYITLDDHYDRYKKEEVMAMNWVGPYFGNYYQEIIKRVITKH